MHRQIGADAVAGAMRIIDAVGPLILPCENVELAAARPLGEARGRKRDMAFQHLGEAAAHLGSRRADRDRSEEHTSELQSLTTISNAVFFLQTKTKKIQH